MGGDSVRGRRYGLASSLILTAWLVLAGVILGVGWAALDLLIALARLVNA